MTRAVTLAEIAAEEVLSVDTTNSRIGIGSTQPTVKLDVDGVVVATAFTGDGSGLTGIAVTNNIITGTAATFTGGVNVSGASNIDVTGVVTATTFSGNITGVAATFSGDVTIGGELTYEDVTNIDSIGIITARSNVSIADSIIHTGDTDTSIRFPAADTFTVETGGSERVRVTSVGRVGVGSQSPNSILDAYAGDGISISNNGDTFLQSRTLNTTGTNYLEFKDSGGGSGAISYHHNGNSLRFKVNGSERIRIADSGEIGIAGANYGTSGQVLTSKGSGASVAWEDASGGGGITTQVGNASGIVTSMFLTDATDHKVTATGICTITTTQSGTEGQSHTIRVVNSGIATVGFSTYFLFPSGSAPVLPTADGAVSIISFTVHDSVGAGCTQLLAGAALNFS